MRLVCLGRSPLSLPFSLELTRFGALLAPLWFPTAIMMVAFYRHAGKMWPGIARLFVWQYSGLVDALLRSSINPTYTAINVVEAVVGALLLRKLLPGTTRCRI